MRYVGIDPSTKTGLVILDESGQVLLEKEITTTAKSDPHRFIDISNSVIKHLDGKTIICIEGFSFGSRGAAVSTQYGIGWMIRSDLFRSGLKYTEVSPGGLKKFASGKGTTKKDELAVHIYKRWGFESKSDNVRDAYVLAQIARAKHCEDFASFTDLKLTEFQKDVLEKVKS